MNLVLESTKKVIGKSKHVKINHEKVKNLSSDFKVPPESNWLLDSPYDINTLDLDQKLMFALMFNALSFSYWGNPYWNVSYKGNHHKRGSWSLVASIFRSIEEEKSLLEPKFLKSATLLDIMHSLRGNTEIPLIEERLFICNKIGEVLTTKYDAKASNFFASKSKDALQLQFDIINEFDPVFNDRYDYMGEAVYFNKRAQAIVESLNSIFMGQRFGELSNLDDLTALADYIIPNLLRNLGILEYSSELAKVIDSEELIEKGSDYEIEIRANTIWTVEYLKIEIQKMGYAANSKSINDYLWTIGRDTPTPFHKTRTTSY